MVRDCVPLQRDGTLNTLISVKCVIRAAFGDQAIMVVSACSVPSKGNLEQSLSLVVLSLEIISFCLHS